MYAALFLLLSHLSAEQAVDLKKEPGPVDRQEEFRGEVSTLARSFGVRL